MEKQDKKARLQLIRMIISSMTIEDQKGLAVELRNAGFVTTQTMLSRDLKQLRISKVRTRSGRSVYALPGTVQFDPVQFREELEATKWYVLFSGNIAVIHTPPGHASLTAYKIDELKSPDILGTVAGDDTIFVVVTQESEEEHIREILCKVIPQLNKKRPNGKYAD